MKKLISNISITILLLLCVGCDQSTKRVAQSFLSDSGAVTYFNDMVRFQYVENQGAFLGLGANMPEAFRFYFFAVLVATILVIAFSLFLINKNKFTNSQALPIIFIFGGGFSNLLDRFMNNGRVVDFMNIGLGNLRTGIFNVADMFILFGTLAIFVTIQNNREKEL